MSIIRKRLKDLRTQNNLTQTELAKALGLSFSAISMYERGERKPDFETLETIADYFNVTMDYLYGKTDIPNEAAERINIPQNANNIIPLPKMNTRDIFKTNLNRFIVSSGKNKKMISDEMGIPYTTLAEWANGKKFPRADGIEKLADYFKILKSDLLEENDNTQRPDILVKTLTDDEKEILYLFEAASPQIRAAALAVLKASDTTPTSKERNK